jgi:DNA-binding response OmpR family regulator
MEKTSCSILIIEDDPDISSTLRMVLEHRGYMIFVLKNSHGIYEMIEDKHIDIMLMDMFLCDANGKDICKELKKNVASAHIPLIMMSAYPDAETICIQAGADDFVSKPFDLDKLLFKIDQFTAPSPPTD